MRYLSRYFPEANLHRRDRLKMRRSSPQLSQLSSRQQLSTTTTTAAANVDYDDRRSVRTVDSFMDDVHSKQSHFFNSLFPSRANR